MLACICVDMLSLLIFVTMDSFIVLFIPIQVSVLVNEAARDINFYMQKAPLFDFTILNSSPGYGSQTKSVFSGSFYFSFFFPLYCIGRALVWPRRSY